MWLTSATGTGSASLTWDAASSNEVLLVAAVGEDATTPVLTLSWPREVTTPWMWPGIVLGVLLVLAGAVYGFVTLRSRECHVRSPFPPTGGVDRRIRDRRRFAWGRDGLGRVRHAVARHLVDRRDGVDALKVHDPPRHARAGCP